MTIRRIVALIALGLFFAGLPASAQESSGAFPGTHTFSIAAVSLIGAK